MNVPDELETKRLRLRFFALADAPRVAELAGKREIAATTLMIPHPYRLEDATEWIEKHPKVIAEGDAVPYAIISKDSGMLIGSIALHLNTDHHHAELGYWVGVPYWNRGYATEAATRVLGFGFDELKLHRIYAHCYSRNSASGRVLENIGMRHEGTFCEHIRKWDQYEDIEHYAILHRDYQAKEQGQ